MKPSEASACRSGLNTGRRTLGNRTALLSTTCWPICGRLQNPFALLTVPCSIMPTDPIDPAAAKRMKKFIENYGIPTFKYERGYRPPYLSAQCDSPEKCTVCDQKPSKKPSALDITRKRLALMNKMAKECVANKEISRSNRAPLDVCCTDAQGRPIHCTCRRPVNTTKT